jgi:lipoic acid synthetase
MAVERVSGKLPSWLKKRIPAGGEASRVRSLLSGLRLNTVCQSALCPNIVECFHCGTATFLILGGACTRNCRFCAVEKGQGAPVEPDEPERVAEAAKALGLSHVVVTSVTRDDLADGGASHFAATIRAIRAATAATIEVLVPDFRGSREAVETVVAAGPDVFNHNIETVSRLYGSVRPMADYRRSLEVLRAAAEAACALQARLVTKSGLMAGLGETIEEIEEVFSDLRAAGCGIVTVGQYLAPSKAHLPVERFVTPEEFERLRSRALAMGFEAAFSAPLVRSSYHAGEVFAGKRG